MAVDDLLLRKVHVKCPKDTLLDMFNLLLSLSLSLALAIFKKNISFFIEFI